MLSEGELVSKPTGSLPAIKAPSRLPDWWMCVTHGLEDTLWCSGFWVQCHAMAFSMRKLKSAVKRTEVCLWRITKHFESKGNVEKWRLLNNLLNCVSCVSSKDAQKLQTSQSNCNFFSSKNSGVSFLKGTVLALFFLVYWGCSKSQIRVVVSVQLTLRAQHGTRAVAFCSNTRNGLSLLVWFSSLDLC